METQEVKLSLEERVSKKMPLAKWIHELYYQNAALFMSDPRYKSLPQYLQTSGISSSFIALKEALDKNRESRSTEETAEKMIEVSNKKSTKKKVA
mgnify:FL=1|jgi:hypothetical protein